MGVLAGLVQQRQRENAAKDAKYKGDLMRMHEVQDRNAALRLQERVEKQMERTFIAQQKRNEQQKMLKEIQRSQDHQFELLQLKHHPHSVSRDKERQRRE